MNELEQRVAALERRLQNQNRLVCFLCVACLSIVALGASDLSSEIVTSAGQSQIGSTAQNGREMQAGQLPPGGGLAGKAADALPPPSPKASTFQIQNLIQTSRLQVVNSNGVVVVDITPATDGAGLIFLNDKNGNQTNFIGSDVNDNGGFSANSSSGDNLVWLGADTGGNGLVQVGGTNRNGGVSVYGESASRIAYLGFSGGSFPEDGMLSLNRETGQQLAFLGGDFERGDGLLNLFTRSGSPLVDLWASAGGAGLWLTNELDRTLVFAGASSDGSGIVNVRDDKGAQTAFIGTSQAGSGLVSINSTEANEVVNIFANVSGNGLVELSNSKGQLGVVAIAGNQNGFIQTLNENEVSLIELKSTATGDGLVDVYSATSGIAWSSSQGGGGSSSSGLGDLDGDGDVDGSDFLIFSEKYGKNPSN